MLELNRCYCMDCMEGMAQFPDGFFDLAVTDPPYFSGPEKRGFYGRKDGGISGFRNTYTIAAETWQVPDERYFREMMRVAKHYIVWGCNYYQHQFPPGRIVWDKCNGTSSFSDAEIAATDIHSSTRLFRYMWNGMLQGKSMTAGDVMQGDKRKNEKRIHPTQKPVILYDWIFERYAQKGWKILDTHLGSGSSRIAAYEAELDFIGFEIDPVMFELEERRFEEYTAQQSLFHIAGGKSE